MPDLENELGAALTAVMRAQGAMVYPLVASRWSPPGWPDKLVWHSAWQGLLELKGPATPWRPGQQSTLGRLWEARPGSAWLLRWVEGVGWAACRGCDALEVVDQFYCEHHEVLGRLSGWCCESLRKGEGHA